MSKLNYVEEDFDQISPLINQNWLLIITATDLETEHTHLKMQPLSGKNSIVKVFKGFLTYYLAKLGNYNVVHVQTSMGSISRDSSIMTVSTALSTLHLKIVVMVGIAFGVNESNQNVGDVLVSESIIPYNVKRVGKIDTVYRGIEAPSSKILLNRFKNSRQTWEFILPDEKKAKFIATRLMSGEELVDNQEHRDKLVEENPDSKGGEMEGIGLYSACDGKADWIVVKGICDFADGNKSDNKKEKQITAINSALSLCLEVFNSKTAFQELGAKSIAIEDNTEVSAPNNLDAVLFDIYDKSKEPYYIKRDVDSAFINKLAQYGLWIFGPSGCGKSNLILRNLINKGTNFIQISLAASIDLSVESLFFEILYDLASNIDGLNYQNQPKNFNELSKALIDLLDKYYKNKELVIFIEEIPINSEADYKDFSVKLFSLIISKNLKEGLNNVKFLLSSINSPLLHIQNFQQKIHQQLVFIPLEYWKSEEIIKLVNEIEKELSFVLPLATKENLITKSNGSPRFIKKFFRSVYTLNKIDEKTLTFILEETERELSHYCHD